MTAALSFDTNERLRARLIGALGPILCDALADPTVTEIMVNEDGRLWLETHDGEMQTPYSLSIGDRQQIIALVADAMGVSAEHGELEADFPAIDDDARGKASDRFQAIMPPIVRGELFVIRRHSARVIPLKKYVERGIVSDAQAEAMISAINERRNIVIAGSTGSGKTTLANALLAEPGFSDCRLVTIEDRMELQVAAENRVQMLATKGRNTIRDLVKATLRLRPDRIVIGEVRDGAALDALKAWNTGHPGGLMTLHADGAHEALDRLEDFVLEVSANPQQRMIGRAIDLVVFIAGRGAARRVREIIRVHGWNGSQYETEEVI